MPRDTVVVGIAGAGKTTYAMDVLEQLMRDGVDPMKIGFCSFSRAACAEAAARAEKVTGVRQTDLQKSGWFRTIHSAVLRAMGIDREAILDHDSVDGKKWMNEHCISARMNRRSFDERGTLASLVGDALSAWDNHRSRLFSTIPPTQPRSHLGVLVSDTEDSEQSRLSFETPYVSEGLPFCTTCACVDTSRAKNASLSHPKDINVHARTQQKCARVWTLSCGKTQGFRDLPHPLCLYGAKMNFILGRGSFQKYACCEKRVWTVDKGCGTSVSSIKNHHIESEELSTPEMARVWRVWTETGKSLNMRDPREHQETPTEIATDITAGCLFTEREWQSLWCRAGVSLSGEQLKVVSIYEQNKRIYGKMDFVDLLLNFIGVEYDDDGSIKDWDSARVWTRPEGVADINHWMFDEYQDCSELLDMCSERLSEAAGERWFLGDRFQCIYDFNASSEACVAHREAVAEKQVLLNRTWRNPECVVEWGEHVLSERKDYVSRSPVAEGDCGSVGLMEAGEFEQLLPMIGREDVMIVARAWFLLARVKTLLDGHGVPWGSLSDKYTSQWDCPSKLAFTLVMRDLENRLMISEMDWRRVTETLPAKIDGVDLFVRGTKARWKKIECGREPGRGLDGVAEWGATDAFVQMVVDGRWKKDMPLLLSEAIDRFGVEVVRNPRVRIGTCHSVKGMEAENVFCLSKSTPAAAANAQEEACLKYVTITRASVNYRLVVDPFDLARNVPLFWAAPRGAQFVKGVDLGTRNTTADEMPETTEAYADAAGRREDLVEQDCWVPDAEKGDAGPPDLQRRETDRDRVQGTAGEGVGDTGMRTPEDQEFWWNL